jgi:hypothetical protein
VPVQLEPVQLEPVQLEPVQLEPVQFEPVQFEPVQFEPVQFEPVQLDPSQPPVQFEPSQLPVQFEPVVSSVVSVESRLPLLASSSVWFASSRTTPSVPRLAASEPVPSEGCTPTFASPAGANSASQPSAKPEPAASTSLETS